MTSRSDSTSGVGGRNGGAWAVVAPFPCREEVLEQPPSIGRIEPDKQVPIEFVVCASMKNRDPVDGTLQLDLARLSTRGAERLRHRQRRVAPERTGVRPPAQIDPFVALAVHEVVAVFQIDQPDPSARPHWHAELATPDRPLERRCRREVEVDADVAAAIVEMPPIGDTNRYPVAEPDGRAGRHRFEEDVAELGRAVPYEMDPVVTVAMAERTIVDAIAHPIRHSPAYIGVGAEQLPLIDGHLCLTGELGQLHRRLLSAPPAASEASFTRRSMTSTRSSSTPRVDGSN